MALTLDQWTEGREIGPVEFRVLGSEEEGFWLETRYKNEQEGGDWTEWEEIDLDEPGDSILQRFAEYLYRTI